MQTDGKIKLKAAAARLFYKSNRDSEDYNMLIEYIDNSEKNVTADWMIPAPESEDDSEHDYRPYCSNCKTKIVPTFKMGRSLGLDGLVDMMNYMPRCFHCGAIMTGKGNKA